MSIDWGFVYHSLPLYFDAAIITLKLAFLGILVSFVLGLACSIILFLRIGGLQRFVKAYVELSRNTPLLIQIFFLYYGLPKLGITLSETTCAILGLSFLGGGYMTETLRCGFEAVGQSQIESGMSIALNKWQLVWYIILPQALSISIPSIGANAIFLLKETSVLGAISILDVMNVTKDLIGMYYKTNESLMMLVGAYLIMLLPISIVLSLLERRIRYAEFGN